MEEERISEDFKTIYKTKHYFIEETNQNELAKKKFKSTIKKKRQKHDKIVLPAKSKLNRIEVLIYQPLIDSVISHDEFVLTNNVSKEYNEMKEEIKNLKT